MRITPERVPEQVFPSISEALEYYESMERSGEPMFHPEEIFETEHILDQMLRGIFVKRGITYQYFGDRFRHYAVNVLGLEQKMTNSNKGNLLKALRRGNITPKTLDITFKVMGLQITDCMFELVDVTGIPIADSRNRYTLSHLREEYGRTH